MTTTNTITYDAIITGGSYAGLSAAMALGRALRKVLIIDSGLPCNRQTPYSHNFITQDGVAPAEIAAKARQQVLAYDTVQWLDDQVSDARALADGFEVKTASGQTYKTRKLLFATGIRDLMPQIAGFAACWGISILHCPYCHGYEVKGRKVAVMANDETAFDYCMMISNWNKDLVLLTNGAATLKAEQLQLLRDKGINVLEQPVREIIHEGGQLKEIRL